MTVYTKLELLKMLQMERMNLTVLKTIILRSRLLTLTIVIMWLRLMVLTLVLMSSPIKIEVHREYDANNNFLGLSVEDYKDLTISADALVADASSFSLSQEVVDAFGVNGTNLVVKAGRDDGTSFTPVTTITDSDGNGILVQVK